MTIDFEDLGDSKEQERFRDVLFVGSDIFMHNKRNERFLVDENCCNHGQRTPTAEGVSSIASQWKYLKVVVLLILRNCLRVICPSHKVKSRRSVAKREGDTTIVSNIWSVWWRVRQLFYMPIRDRCDEIHVVRQNCDKLLITCITMWYLFVKKKIVWSAPFNYFSSLNLFLIESLWLDSYIAVIQQIL